MAAPKWFDYATYKTNKLAQLQQLDSSWTMAKMEDAFTKAGFTGTDGYYQHFQKYGHTEDVSPNKLFSAEYYYKAKALQFYTSEAGGSIAEETVQDKLDYYAQQVKGLINNAGMDAWTHYIKYGTAEGINPSNSFDTAAYMADKLTALQAAEPSAGWTEETMNAAFKKAGLNALSHFMAYAGNGNANEVAEGMAAHGTVPDAYVVPESEQIDDESDATGITFTLTADNAVLTSSSNVRATPANSYMTTGDDTVNAFNFFSTATVEDKSTTDNDTVNGNLSGAFAGTLKNIENVKIDFATGATFDTSKASGVKNYIASASSDLAAGEGFTNVDTTLGDSAPTYTFSGSHNLGLTTKAMTGSSDALNIVLNGFTGGLELTASANTDNLEDLNIEALGSASSTALTMTTFAGTATTGVKKMTVTGDQDLTIKVADDTQFAGAAASMFKAIDASSHTGSLALEFTDNTLTAARTIDMTNYKGVDKVIFDVAAATSETISNAGSDFSVELNKVAAYQTLTVTGDKSVVAGNSDVLNVSASHTAAQTVGDITFSGYETLNITAAGTKGLTIADLVTTGNAKAVDSVVLTGTENVTLTALGATALIEKFDASTLNGTLSFGAAVGSTTIEEFSSAMKDTTVDLAATAGKLNLVEMGAGKDAITIGSTVTTAGQFHFTEVDGMAKGDTLKMGANLTTATMHKSSVDISSATSANDIFKALAANDGNNTVANNGYYISDDANTYLYISTAADQTEDAGDFCVQLTGVTDISTWTAAAGVLTAAEY